MQEHPELIKLIEQHHLHSPSAASVPLNLSHLPSEEELAGQKGQARSVEELLEGKTGGFFIEAGAWDGEAISNTRVLITIKRMLATGLHTARIYIIVEKYTKNILNSPPLTGI